MENIKKGLEKAIGLIKTDLKQTIDNYQFYSDVGVDKQQLSNSILNSLDTIVYLQELINSIDKEIELDSAVNEALKETNKDYKPIVNYIVTNKEDELTDEEKEIERHWGINRSFK